MTLSVRECLDAARDIHMEMKHYREALWRYGRHDDDCDLDPRQCSCGFNQALRGKVPA